MERTLIALTLMLTLVPAKAQPPVSDPAVREFASVLCRRLATARADGESIVGNLKSKLLEQAEINPDAPDALDQAVAYYNAHENDFICVGKVTANTRPTEHLFKRAVSLRIEDSILDDFFFNTDEVDVSVNAVEWVQPDPETDRVSGPQVQTGAPWGIGEPETLLDYLNKILADPRASQSFVVQSIQRLRDDIIEQFGAKRACELLDDVPCAD